MRPIPLPRPALALAAALLAAACATGDAGDPRPADDVVGEVVEVELFERQLLVRNTFDRVVRLRYDAGTPVFYRGQRYPIDALDLGDIVRVEVFGDERGALFAQRIEVEETVEDRDGTRRPTPDIEEVDGEVVRVERLPNVLVLDSDARGTLRIGYSADTPVYYRGDQYAITNLEPGDEVRAEVREDAGGDLRTDYVVVTRSVQEREGGGVGGGDVGGDGGDGDVEAGEVETFTGRVDRVDERRGEFTIDRDDGGDLRVLMPLRALTADQDRFARLRAGDRVRFDGEWLGEGRVVLVRFDLGY